MPIPTLYDHHIQHCVGAHLPGHDWRLVRAQLWQESRLQANAVSPAGAVGVGQFMPGTWADMMFRHTALAGKRRVDPEASILACVLYMRELHNQWTAPRPAIDRYCLTLASYNAGLGNVLKAQRVAGGVNDYATISRHLVQVTGVKHSNETVQYVRKILGYWHGQIVGDL